MPAIHVSRHLVGAGLLAAALASGCATTTAPLAPDGIGEVSAAAAPEETSTTCWPRAWWSPTA